MLNRVAVVGAGLAGSECAWILAQHYNLSVTLFEMKRVKQTPAQISPHLFAELVCSNSLKSESMLNPAGVLKHEMIALGSLVLPAAKQAQVPAGETLAVDREVFSQQITNTLSSHPNIQIHHGVIETIEHVFSFGEFDAVVFATGPLTDGALAQSLNKVTDTNDLYFYDAIAPIIDGETIDYTQVFRANRQSRTQAYEQKKRMHEACSTEASPSHEDEPEDDGDYLNIPLNKDEYYTFVEKVLSSPQVPLHEFEEARYFNGCQPIEALAERGPKTLSFGPMKPKGLTDPKTGRFPYAVVQLRKEKANDFAWNMVGFQTRLTWGAQKEVFRTLPGLRNAEFFRMGSLHRNTYLVSPKILNDDLSFKNNPKLYLAGQIMGVEGYLESAAMGVYLGHHLGLKLTKQIQLTPPPANTSLGALVRYCLYSEPKHFTPMNIHWGLFENLTSEEIEKYKLPQMKSINQRKLDKSEKRELLSLRAKDLFQEWLKAQFTALPLSL